ncbi:MAG: alkaline phosphatase family protein, partial [Polaribacter sp.]|nr:alkaline phosphatase family protein [Polaribacter sp.]
MVDQMRYDYLTRYYNRFGNDGFKRLLNEGFSVENAHFNYIPTYTAVGHTSIYTGTTPDHHGIIGNNWYDKFLKKSIYCVDDFNYTSVGTDSDYGQKSPYRLTTTTVTDQLLLAQNMRGKSIGIALKDRSAILPVGHTATAAYWYEGKDKGHFITSSFYRNDLPTWVTDFNKLQKAAYYTSKPWNTLYDIKTYTNSTADNSIFEGVFTGEKLPVFPHDIPNLKKENGNLSIISETPFGNSLTLDFAKAAIIGENLGKNKDTDFLAVSFSSTDYVGHKYGVDAVETEDTYLRLDKDLAELFRFLDEKVGKGKYTIFLTADHGAIRVPAYLDSLRIPAKYFNTRKFKTFLDSVSTKHFKSTELVENFSNYQLFLDKEKINSLGLKVDDVAEIFADELVNFETISKAVTAKTLQKTNFTKGILNVLQNGYNQKLSGDVLLIPNPGTISGKRTGTTHGSGFSYDTHVPIIFYGKGIKKGVSKKYYEITDIAPTIANLLKIEAPNSTTG